MNVLDKRSDLLNKTPEEILEMFDFTNPPFDPFQVAKEIGINISTNAADWNKLGYDGEIYLNDHKIPEIWINPTQYDNRQRFTLAHELGHLINDVLPDIEHFKDPIKDDYTTLRRSNKWDTKEYKANRFAAQLLMPKKSIFDIGQKTLDAYIAETQKESMSEELFIEKMAQIFQVSKEAMKFRLINLGILTNGS